MADFAFTYKPGVPMSADGTIRGDDCETGVEVTQGIPFTFIPNHACISVQQMVSSTVYPVQFRVFVDEAKLPITPGIKNFSFQAKPMNAVDTCDPPPEPLVYTVEVTVPPAKGKFKPRK